MSNLQIIAIVVAAVFAVLLLWALIAWRRTQYTLPQAFLYFINYLFTSLLWRTQISGPLSVPPGQGAIIVSNHISGIDPLLIQRTTSRVVHWMVAREYVEHWSMAWAFRILQAIPVNRAGIDTSATKRAIRMASEGSCVGMFPEGRINRERAEVLLPGRPGAALVALKARVPVVPCYVEGAPYNGTALGSFLMRANTKVTVGEPIDISAWYDRDDDRSVHEELTKKFMVEIAKLAGVPNFEPKLAGKRWRPEDEAPAESEGAVADAGTNGGTV